MKTWKLVVGSLLALSFANAVMADHVNEECRATDKISCVDLAIGISAVDTQLDNAVPPVVFAGLGELLAAVKASEALFGQVNTILNSAVGLTFATLDEFYDAVNQCGLIPHVIDEINDGVVL